MTFDSFSIILYPSQKSSKIFGKKKGNIIPKSKAIEVIDGDTIKIPGKAIRLANVDVPELGTKGSIRTKYQLKDMALGKTITHNPLEKSYGRVVIHVKLKGKSINQAVRNKLR